MRKPLIGIPMGDPAGVGAEIIAKALAEEKIRKVADCVVYGETWIMEEAVRVTKTRLKIEEVTRPEQARDGKSDRIYLLDQYGRTSLSKAKLKRGQISGECGQAAYKYIEICTKDALAKKLDAIATAPVNKESFREGNVPYIGHTEILAGLTGTKDPLTMFEVKNMRVFFLSRHVSLRQACDMVKKDRIVEYVKRCSEALGQLGLRNPRIAIAGLNPHGGEHGLFGEEEDLEIRPAVSELVSEGFLVEGPVGADSVFHLALEGRYDAVLSLYHDQGHIATKTLDFYRTIALTLGLPFLRTSVDHGTAMDIAGRGIASPVSMEEAIRLAAKYVRAGWMERLVEKGNKSVKQPAGTEEGKVSVQEKNGKFVPEETAEAAEQAEPPGETEKAANTIKEEDTARAEHAVQTENTERKGDKPVVLYELIKLIKPKQEIAVFQGFPIKYIGKAKDCADPELLNATVKSLEDTNGNITIYCI